jgi:hypothetical protein
VKQGELVLSFLRRVVPKALKGGRALATPQPLPALRLTTGDVAEMR